MQELVSKQVVIDMLRSKLQFFRDDLTCKTAAEIRSQIEEIINSITGVTAEIPSVTADILSSRLQGGNENET